MNEPIPYQPGDVIEPMPGKRYRVDSASPGWLCVTPPWRDEVEIISRGERKIIKRRPAPTTICSTGNYEIVKRAKR